MQHRFVQSRMPTASHNKIAILPALPGPQAQSEDANVSVVDSLNANNMGTLENYFQDSA